MGCDINMRWCFWSWKSLCERCSYFPTLTEQERAASNVTRLGSVHNFSTVTICWLFFFPPHITDIIQRLCKVMYMGCFIRRMYCLLATEFNMSYQNCMNLPQFTSDIALIFGQTAQYLGNAVLLFCNSVRKVNCFSSLLKCHSFSPQSCLWLGATRIIHFHLIIQLFTSIFHMNHQFESKTKFMLLS